MTGWGKGIVEVNGFNIGQFWKVGPQTRLYIPATLLKKGNLIIIFETEGRLGDITDQIFHKGMGSIADRNFRN